MDDARLANDARAGDLVAWEALVLRYQEIAFRSAYLVTNDAADAEDCVQDALIKAYEALDSFDTARAFRPWLLRIVTNEARNRRRSTHRRVRALIRASSMTAGIHHEGPEHMLVMGEDIAHLREEINRLGERDRIVVLYRYMLELSIHEIATTLDIPESTVRTRLSRAIARLRSRLITTEPDEPLTSSPRTELSHG